MGYPQISHLTLDPKVQNLLLGEEGFCFFKFCTIVCVFFKLCFKLFLTRSPSIHVLLFTNQGVKRKKETALRVPSHFLRGRRRRRWGAA